MKETINSTTLEIKRKGYKLPEALKLIGISLSTYRRYEKENHSMHKTLLKWINELESK